jgi:acid phosphatase type 7
MRRFLIVFSVLGLCVAASVVGIGAPLPRAAAADPVIVAAGDIACPPPGTPTATRCHQAATANLIDTIGPAAVLPVGDEQYPCGRLDAFNAVYDPSWGRFKNISRPVVGDNEYVGSTCSTPGAEGYYTYFGNRASPQEPGCTINCKGYYSYDLGSWHIIALNSECKQPGVGGCNGTGAQGKWLKADLAAHPAQCTLAYWHRPHWSDKGGTFRQTQYFVKTLYAAGADLLLVGHQHIYERFAPMNPSSVADPNGIRQFIVGTGGYSHGTLAATPPANSDVRSTGTSGVLKLTLHPTSYDWQFVPEAGKTFTDTGSQACH